MLKDIEDKEKRDMNFVLICNESSRYTMAKSQQQKKNDLILFDARISVLATVQAFMGSIEKVENSS